MDKYIIWRISYILTFIRYNIIEKRTYTSVICLIFFKFRSDHRSRFIFFLCFMNLIFPTFTIITQFGFCIRTRDCSSFFLSNVLQVSSSSLWLMPLALRLRPLKHTKTIIILRYYLWHMPYNNVPILNYTILL